MLKFGLHFWEEIMGLHKSPRCQGCKHALDQAGNEYTCGLLEHPDGSSVRVISITTVFQRYENCAYRLWDQFGEILPGPTLVAMARMARTGDIPTDFSWESRVA